MKYVLFYVPVYQIEEKSGVVLDLVAVGVEVPRLLDSQILAYNNNR